MKPLNNNTGNTAANQYTETVIQIVRNKRFIEINDRKEIEWGNFVVVTVLTPEHLSLFTLKNASLSYSTTICGVSVTILLKLTQKAAFRSLSHWLAQNYISAVLSVGRLYNNKIVIAVKILPALPNKKLIKPWNEALESAVQHCPPEKKILLGDVLRDNNTESKIIIDLQTGVHYLFYGSTYGCTMTPMLDSKGEPIVLSEDEITMELMTNDQYIE